ncbi:hypothetical protein SS50377_28020 [Spironucleus salmonicida]|uniref:Uncharacterized protein n=1 Tax=Spironucleus salmonicida TaxID=348837 RepID=V6LFU6_9EUKA|nr:hypothetical protein SS50377_28020 [Spironucleus salmonicida]|eukprot:EST42576.1 Hypothetical protein SS50377_17893 [Spironucleus salmonicida]
MNPIFLNMKISDIQPEQGLATKFTFSGNLATLTIDELTTAIKLWSKRLQTINSALKSLNSKLPDPTVPPHIAAFTTERDLLHTSFEAAIAARIRGLTAFADPSVPFSQLVALSIQLNNSNFPRFPLHNLLVPFYLKFCKNADRVLFASFADAIAHAETYSAVRDIPQADHWQLSGAGAALYACGGASFGAVLDDLLRRLESEEIEAENYKFVTALAEQLKMFKREEVDLERLAQVVEAVHAQFRRIKTHQNVYIYLFDRPENFAMQVQTPLLDLFHQASWSAISALFRLIGMGGNVAFFGVVLSCYHADSLMNFERGMISCLTQNQNLIPIVIQFFTINFKNEQLPIQRRCGCVPYVFSAIWRVIVKLDQIQLIQGHIDALKAINSIPAKFALRSLFREKLVNQKGKRAVSKGQYIDIILYAIESCGSDYLERNASFQLFSCSVQQLFTHFSVHFKDLSDLDQQKLLEMLCQAEQKQLLSLAFLSYLKPSQNQNLVFLDVLQKIENESTSVSIKLLTGRCYQVFLGTKNIGVENILQYEFSPVKAIAIRQMLRGYQKFKLGRGHGLFREVRAEKIDGALAEKIKNWLSGGENTRDNQALIDDLGV